SINIHRMEKSTSGAKSLLASINTIGVDGDQVVFTLNSPNVDFPYFLYHFQLAILPSDGAGNVDWKSGDGTGGYILESFQPGINAIARRNPNYWKPDSAYFDEIEIIAIRDATARINALLTQEVDAIDEVDPKTADLLKKTDGVVVDEAVGIE